MKSLLKNLEFKHSFFAVIAVAVGCIAQELMEAHIQGERFTPKFIWVLGLVVSFSICILIEYIALKRQEKSTMESNPLHPYRGTYWIEYKAGSTGNLSLFCIRHDREHGYHVIVREYNMYEKLREGKKWDRLRDISACHCSSKISDVYFFVVHSPSQSQERIYVEINPESGEIWTTGRDTSERIAHKGTKIDPDSQKSYAGKFHPEPEVDIMDFVAREEWKKKDKDVVYQRQRELRQREEAQYQDDGVGSMFHATQSTQEKQRRASPQNNVQTLNNAQQ